MPEELSGEQKLRIVLESIIRNVPKEEQCQKYEISEEEYQGWHDHLITNGGKIFDPDFGSVRTRVKRVRKMSTLSRLFLILSVLGNLACIVIVSVKLMRDSGTDGPKPADASESLFNSSADSPLHSGQAPPDDPQANAVVAVESPPAPTAGTDPVQPSPPRGDLDKLLAKPFPLPRPETLPPVALPEPERVVSLMGKDYKGKHVVYLLDVGSYVLKGEGADELFEGMKSEVLSSIANLSPNSYFNMVLFWNLREASALGKTILRANQE